MNITRCALLFLLATTAAQAGPYEEGLRYKQEQKLEQAATAFGAAVKLDPKNPLALEQLATVQGWLNRYDESIASWRKAIALAPKKQDYRVGLARIHYWKGERAAALAELDTALKLAPKDADALMLRGDVLMADARPGEAREAYLAVRSIRGDDAALAQKIENAVAPKAWRLDAGHIGDDYSEGRPYGNSSYLQLGYAASPAATVYVRLDRFSDFDSIDSGATLGGYFLPADWLLLNAELGISSGTVNFRSDEQAALNAEILLSGPVQPLLGVRHLGYENGNVLTITPGLRFLLGLATLEARYGSSKNTDDSRTEVAQARLSFDFGFAAPYLAYAEGEEAIPPLALAEVSIIGAGCVFNLSPSWGARVDYSREDRKDTYIHDAYGLGLTYKF